MERPWSTVGWVAKTFPTGDVWPLARRLHQTIDDEDNIAALAAQIIIRRRHIFQVDANRAQEEHNRIRLSQVTTMRRATTRQRKGQEFDMRVTYLEQLAAYRPILAKTFTVVPGEPAVVGKATRDQWVRRNAYIRKKVAGHQKELTRNEFFIEAMDAIGASTLDEVFGA